VQYNTHRYFVDHHLIWELAEDTYLINLAEPNLFLVKCTLKQAIVFTPAQISLLKITTREQSDQNKVVLRLGLLIAKYDDLSLCAFKIMRDEANGIKIFDSIFQIQSLTLKFLIEQSPLLPKTVRRRLQEDNDALRRQHCRKVDPQQEPKLKGIMFAKFYLDFNFGHNSILREVEISFNRFFSKNSKIGVRRIRFHCFSGKW